MLLFYSGAQCGVCHALLPKVQELLEQNFPKMRFANVDCEAHPDIAAQHQVFTVPTIDIYFAGKSTTRLSSHFSIEQLSLAIQRQYSLLFE